MSEPVLTLLKFGLVGVLYVFFFVVLRAVWAEVRDPAPSPAPTTPPAPSPAPTTPPAPSSASAPPTPPSRAWGTQFPDPVAAPPGRLRVVRPAGLSGQSFPLTAAEATVGRAPGCAVLLDDPTVSSLHARLTRQGDQVLLDDLGSRNGTLLNGRRVRGPSPLAPGDRLGIGPNVELEVLP